MGNTWISRGISGSVAAILLSNTIVGGAAMGALLDNIIHKEVVVYRADRRGGGSAKLSVTPSIGPNARGVHVAWTF